MGLMRRQHPLQTQNMDQMESRVNEVQLYDALVPRETATSLKVLT